MTRNDSDGEQQPQSHAHGESGKGGGGGASGNNSDMGGRGHFQVLSESATLNVFYDGDARSEVEDHFAKAINQDYNRSTGTTAAEKGKKGIPRPLAPIS